MTATYVVGVRIDGNAAGYLNAVNQATRGTRSLMNTAREEFGRLRQFMQSYQGQLAGLGLSAGLFSQARDAALLERKLTQVRLTAGMSAKEQAEAHKELFDLAKRYGGTVEDTTEGFNNLVQAGLKYKEALEAIKAVSLGKAVSGANDSTLAGALTVGAANYNLDLAKPGVAIRMLDQMTVAGRLGNAELENLGNIFPRVAQRAQSAGLAFAPTLAFIESLSKIERQPERLATLADSTLRLFTNAHYAKDAEKATGVKFFAQDGSRRNPVTILEDMRKGFAKLKTEAAQFAYVSKAFGKADLDTQRGLLALLASKTLLEDIRSFTTEIENAGGTLAKDVPTALANAASQSERLKNTLREASDGFARPINDAVARSIAYLIDAKDKGGLGLSGGQISAGGIGAVAAAYGLGRVVPGLAGRLLGRAGGMAAGVAEGKALQAAAGIQPVYVTNWAEMGGGSGLASLGGGAAAGAAGAAAVGWLARLRNMAGVAALLGNAPLSVAGAGAVAGSVGLAGLGGAAVGFGAHKLMEGSGISNAIGGAVADVLALFGNAEAKQAVALNEALRQSRVGGEIVVRVESNPNLAVQHEARPFNGTRMRVQGLGQTNLAAGY